MFASFYKIFRSFRFTLLFYRIILILVLFFVLSFLFPLLLDLSYAAMIGLLFMVFIDGWLLFRNANPAQASRAAKYQRLSNGDLNEMTIRVSSSCSFKVNVKIVDEVPEQFQMRDFMIGTSLEPGEVRSFTYQLRPLERGEYHFGVINLFLTTSLNLTERHILSGEPMMMPSYPSFIKLRQYELLAISNRLSELGVKKIRRVGHSTEFEQIREYVRGDDVRKINWRATARRSELMLNHFRDERAQQVYCVIDMGRIMKMPFDGLSLLDYAVNSSLVISHVAWIKQDKPGLIGFAEKPLFTVNADRKGNQLLRLQESLYNAKTNFGESSYESLLSHVRQKITKRSLIMLYTNFETLSGLKRQLKYIRRIATQHLVVIVFFENTELKNLLSMKPRDTFDIYEQTIAQKFDYEKRQITRELQQYGILWVYTSPQQLTINTLNKYLEIKTRGLI